MSNRTCSVDGCDQPHRAKGLCKMHWHRQRYTGILDLTGTCCICSISVPYGGKGRRRTLCDSDACRRAYQVQRSTEYRRRNPELVRQAKRRSVAKKPEYHATVRRAAHLRREFGLTILEYDEMLASQGGGCAICGATEGNSRRKRLAVDHDHDTNAIRGLLCYRCNSLLGNARDTPDILQAAIAYLSR